MPPPNDRTAANRRRAESFGAVAETYDRVRPGYPPALFDDLMVAAPTAALDVGCGTGQVAQSLLRRGLTVVGVEIDERMAQVARSHGITVEVGGFETWDADGRQFDLITCGQAWHWLDPVAAPAKAAALLRSDGQLALFWNFITFDQPTWRALDAAYDRAAPQLTRESVLRGGGPATIARHIHDLDASARFGPARVSRYEWSQAYPRDDYLALISSHSDHSTLPPEQLDGLRLAVGAAIDALGGRLDARYVTHALLARVR